MTYLLGIAGVSGSGKGTITDLIQQHLNLWKLSTHILSTDDCYGQFDYLTRTERDEMCFNPTRNWDHPSSVDFKRRDAYASNLKTGVAFSYRRYDFDIHMYGQEQVEVPKNLDVAIIEGIYALYPNDNSSYLPLFDKKIFVVTPAEIAVIRRTLRDIKERHRDVEHIARQYEKTVRPMQKQFIIPTRNYADDIIDWQGNPNDPVDQDKMKLIEIARQKALLIYEAVRGPVLAKLNQDEITITLG